MKFAGGHGAQKFEGRGILRRMGVRLVGETPDGDAGAEIFFEQLLLEDFLGPGLPMSAVSLPSLDEAEIGPMLSGESPRGGQVALEVAAGEAEAWLEIGVRPDPSVEAQGGSDLGPVGADALAKLSHGVGRGHARDEEEIDRDLRELGAFVAHYEHRAAEGRVPGAQRGGQRLRGIRRADDEAFWLQRALHGGAEDERLHLIIDSARPGGVP